MIELSHIAERIRDARIYRNLNLDEAARKIGISERSLRRYESEGIRDLVMLDRICDCYQVSLTDIIGGRNDLAYLAGAINRLGKNVCDVVRALCDALTR